MVHQQAKRARQVVTAAAGLQSVVDAILERLPAIDKTADNVERIIDQAKRTGELNKRSLKIALTKHQAAVDELGKLRAPSHLRPGEREVFDEKKSALNMFYVERVQEDTAALKKALDDGDAIDRIASMWEARIGRVAASVRKNSIPNLVEEADNFLEPESRFGSFVLIDKHAIKQFRTRYWFEAITRAEALLKRKGFGYLLYGRLDLKPFDRYAGLYHQQGDYIALNTGEKARPDVAALVRVLVHELAHRLWFRFLDTGARDRFAKPWLSQEESVRELFAKIEPLLTISPSEVEEAWKHLSRTWLPADFLKWAGRDKARRLRWMLVLERVYALSVSETEMFAKDGALNPKAFALTKKFVDKAKENISSRDSRIFGPQYTTEEEQIKAAQEKARQRLETRLQYLRDSIDKAAARPLLTEKDLRAMLEPAASDVAHPLGPAVQEAFNILRIQPSVTPYGQTNRMEDFAEVFTEVIMGTQKDRDVQLRLQAVLPKGRVVSTVTAAAFNRAAVFAVFQHAVLEIWGAKPTDSPERAEKRNAFIKRLRFEMSHEQADRSVMASLTFNPRLVSAIDDALLMAAPLYVLRVSDALLEQPADVVKGIMRHEALHVGYPKHDIKFRTMAAKYRIPLTESWTKDPGWKVQRKEGARFVTIKTFEDEREARRFAQEEMRRVPGKYRLSASVARAASAVGQDWFGPFGQRYRIVEDTGDGWRVEIQHKSSDLPAEESWMFTKDRFEQMKRSLPLSRKSSEASGRYAASADTPPTPDDKAGEEAKPGKKPKQDIDPDKYREERGRCPRGYTFDGERCKPSGPKEKELDEEPSDETAPEPEGVPDVEQVEKPTKTLPKKKAPKAPKKPKIVPQGPQVEVTKENRYGLDEATRGAKTVADIGGHEALRKVLGHMEPSKLPPPDVDPATIQLNLDGDNDSKAMMTWRDSKGRLQAAYTPKFLNRNAAVKWERVKKLEAQAEKAINGFKWRMQLDSLSTKDRDAAAILTIIGKTGLRPGSVSSLQKTGHRGITTLAANNVKIKGNTVKLEFVGKSGKTNQTTIKDPELAKYLRERMAGKKGDDLLFEAREKDLPATMESVGAKGFKPKDFRTRVAGKIAANVMSKLDSPPPPMPTSPTKAKKLIEKRMKEASDAVAGQLNNTPAMAKKAYINPAIFKAWADSVGASEYLAAAAADEKPTADDLWRKALDIKLPEADEPVGDMSDEQEDDDQLDSVPEPDIKGAVEARLITNVVTRLLDRGHRDLATAVVTYVTAELPRKDGPSQRSF